ncbi:MAG: AMP-binding protein [Streptosporangiales bacterium]|nr:AMP-binding protein [Streptosporangiales bacterium]
MHLLDPEVEKATPAELRRLQWEGLDRFLRDRVWSNPFYAHKYALAGVRQRSITDQGAFTSLPTVDKSQILEDVRQHPPFGSRSVLDDSDLRQVVETTGTSGRGRERYPLNQTDVDGVRAMERFGFHWAGVTKGSVVMSCLPLTTRAAGQWYHDAVRSLGGVFLATGNYDTAEKLRYLSEYDVSLLCASSPSYLRRLEVAALNEGMSPRDFGVRAIMVAGEPFSIDWLVEREEVWGARIFEQYGSTQRAIAWCCDRGAVPGGGRGVLHTLPHLALYEVVDPETGEEVADGEAGELIITPFSATSASPLVRFATGDRVTKLPADACPCGRTLPAFEAGTVERYDNVFRARGVNFAVSDIDDVVLNSGAREYQARIYIDQRTGREELEILAELEPGPDHGETTLREIATRLRDAMGLRFDVRTYEGSSLLPEGKSDLIKRQRWSDQRESRGGSAGTGSSS